jgi:hypothetical protein
MSALILLPSIVCIAWRVATIDACQHHLLHACICRGSAPDLTMMLVTTLITVERSIINVSVGSRGFIVISDSVLLLTHVHLH